MTIYHKNNFGSTLVLILIFFSFNVQSQSIITGTILNKNDSEALAYVNIGIISKNIGTVSNIEGKFKLLVPPAFTSDSIRFSMIGFKSKTFIAEELIQMFDSNSTLYLEPEVMELKTLIISGEKLKRKTLGSKTRSKSIMAGFEKNELGNEVGIILKLKNKETIFKNFNVSVSMNKYESAKLRFNIYTLKNGFPDKNILNENIILKVDQYDDILSIDLSPYNIILNEDCYIGLEWLEDLGEGGLLFSAGFFGAPIISRKTSQADWEKVKGVTIGMNVEVLR